MNFIKKLFSKKKDKKINPEEVIDKPYIKPIDPISMDNPINPYNPIPVPKDPTIKDK